MHWRLILKRPISVVAVAALVLILGGLLAVSWLWLERERERRTHKFAAERLDSLELVATEVEEALEDATDTLLLAGRMVRLGADEQDLRRPLTAMLGATRAYRAFLLFDGRGRQLLSLSDPKRPFERSPQLDAAIGKAVRRTLSSAAAGILVSSPTEMRQYSDRVFTLRLRSLATRVAPVVLALVVDMRPLLAKFRLVMTRETWLLALGPRGNPLALSHAALARRAMRRGGRRLPPAMADLLERMRRGQRGLAHIPAVEAKALGLGSADLAGAYVAMKGPGGRHWAVATLSSMHAVNQHERGLIVRLGLGALMLALVLGACAVVVLQSNYRQLQTEERLAHTLELAQLHEKAGTILASIPTGVLVVGPDERITDMNAALRERLGAAALGAPLDEAFPVASADAVSLIRALVRQAVAEGRTVQRLGERLDLLGVAGSYRLHAVPFTPALPDAHALLVVEDITELKGLQDQVLRAEKLATVGTLSAGIAHEIGTPLTVLRCRTEYILGQLEPTSPHTEGLRSVIEQSDRIVRSIRSLLDFSRANVTRIQAVALHRVVDQSVELLRLEARRRRVALVVEVAADLPPLAADPDQLQQVLVNLLMNAFDATGPKREVAITARLTEPPAGVAEATHVTLAVRDQGSGIAPKDQQRVFDPFFTTKQAGLGTGLGLFIVAQIASQHGAEIALQSEVGHGTTVTLTWPLWAQEDTDDA